MINKVSIFVVYELVHFAPLICFCAVSSLNKHHAAADQVSTAFAESLLLVVQVGTMLLLIWCVAYLLRLPGSYLP